MEQQIVFRNSLAEFHDFGSKPIETNSLVAILSEDHRLAVFQFERRLRPLIAVGGDFWDRFETFVREAMIAQGTITEQETQVIHRAETAEDVARIVREGTRPY